MSGSEAFRDVFIDPPSSGEAKAWGEWGVAFLDGLGALWARWQKSWTRDQVSVVRPGNPDAFLVLGREARIVGYKDEMRTGDPPFSLDSVGPPLKRLAAEVQRFSAGGDWVFQTTQKADEVAESLLKLAQDFKQRRYEAVRLSQIEQLSRLMAMATMRGSGASKGPPQPRRGRRPTLDPKRDEPIAEAWASGQYKTHADLAREMRLSTAEVKKAIDRHRKRN